MVKKLYFILTVFSFLNSIQFTSAQSVLSIEAGRVFSTFKFFATTNSEQHKQQTYSAVTSTTLGLAYTYINSKGGLFLGGFDLRKAGAFMSYNQINYAWNLQYIDIKAGLGYQFNKWYLKPYAAIIPYYAYLLNAKQTIGPNYYDIKGTRSLKNYDWGTFLNLGFRADVFSHASIFAEYN